MATPRNKAKLNSVSSILSQVVQHRHLADKFDAYSAFPMWPEIVGEKIASITFPEKIIRGNLLVVKVIDSAWVQELTLRKEEILALLQKQPKGAYIQDIRWVAGSPKEFSAFGKKAVHG